MPASGATRLWHIAAGRAMGLSMLALPYFLAAKIDGGYEVTEIVLAITMAALAPITYADKRHFAYYEIAFLAFNHATIVMACLALA